MENIDRVTDDLRNETNESIPGTYNLPPYIFWYVTIANAAIFVVGVLGNLFVLTVVITNKSMRTHMNVLLCSLSVADLLVLLICQPAGMIEFYGKDRWFLGEFLCKLIPFLENASLNSSVLTMWVISCERFQAICRTLRNSSCVGTMTASKLIICIWMTACLLCLPFLFLTHQEPAKFFDGTDVIVCRTKITTSMDKFYVVFLFITFFVMPLLIMTIIYIFILKKIYATQKQLDENRPSRHRRQIIAMIITIIALFYASLFPIRIITLWLVFGPIDSLQQFGFIGYINVMCIARIMLNINSSVNPIIYGIISTRFQQAFKTTVKRCFCEQKKSVHERRSRSNYEPASNATSCKSQCFMYCFHVQRTDGQIQETNV